MELTVLSGAATIALASAVIFLLVVRSWAVFANSTATTRFPATIMQEAAQRFRDEIARLSREQSVYLASSLVFTVIFCISYLLPPKELFDGIPRWQLVVVLLLLAIGAGFFCYRLVQIVVARRRLIFVRDANIATGHSLQKITSNRNRVFHDVPCSAGIIDHVIVGLHGIYTVSVVARTPARRNLVRLKGSRLQFAGKESVSIERSGEKTARLAKELEKYVSHPIRVRSVIAIPGWETDSQQSDDYLAVNERNLAMLTGWKDEKDFLMNEDVDVVQELLTELCTRFRPK